MIKRISTKKTYKVMFTNGTKTTTVEVTGKKSMTEIAAASKDNCDFVPEEMHVTDVLTGDTNKYIMYFDLVAL